MLTTVNRLIIIITIIFCAKVHTDNAAENNVVQHKLQVILNPANQHIQVTDQITLPASSSRNFIFSLRKNLHPVLLTPNLTLNTLNPQSAESTRYKLSLADKTKTFTIQYAGDIFQPLASNRRDQAGGYSSTSGIISSKGVYLAGSSHWFAQFERYPYSTFSLQVESPAGWKTISQGERATRKNNKGSTVEIWTSKTPQQEIYLIAAPFVEYSRQSGDIHAQVFLRHPAEKLADKYLKATIKYINMYQQLLGTYPYSKFALVENFWETGFGMPSFTLLGPTVIRLPFIINSSYPHEILHNWWGNGVYVDFQSGNWSEGLTAYLADHLIKQQQGLGASYRLHNLQKYRDYASKNRDFPLTQFRGRHSSASAAVGYGKAMMLFHMLRQQTGDELFIKALRHFFADHLFKSASYNDLQQTFETVTGLNLDLFFRQWTERTGAPELTLSHAKVTRKDNKYQLSFSLQQVQPDETYQLAIPYAVTLEGQKNAFQSLLTMTQSQQHVDLTFSARPIRLDIDPQFDLFRKLDIGETPVAFSQLFGSQKLLVILPRTAPDKMRQGWKLFAESFKRMGPDLVEILADDELDTLPDDRATIVLGWNNRFAPDVLKMQSENQQLMHADPLIIENNAFPRYNHSVAITFRDPEDATLPRAFIATEQFDALAGLARKLPHYHKYSYLVFSGSEPQIKIKGRWPVSNSPLVVTFEKNAGRGELESRPALTEAFSDATE